MPFVVAEPCVNCRYTECVESCPVDCFHLDETMLVIDPEACIDCAACVPECPVDAIYEEDELPAEWRHYIELNRRRAAELPVITKPLPPLTDERPDTG